jgi:hypothetical protein
MVQTTPTRIDSIGTKNAVFVFFFKRLQGHQTIENDTTNTIEEAEISKLADNWGKYKDKVLQASTAMSTCHTAFTDSFRENCSLLLTEDILSFCLKNNIYDECCKYHTLFIENFKNIRSLDIYLSEDPEIQNYQHLSFILTIADSIENVLQYEDNFREKLDREIQIEKRLFFVYNYNLI